MESSVDLDETARVVDALVAAGIDAILSMGTLGECATLTDDERRSFMATLVESARGRIPVFVGTTALGTRKVIEETRYARTLAPTVRCSDSRCGARSASRARSN